MDRWCGQDSLLFLTYETETFTIEETVSEVFQLKIAQLDTAEKRVPLWNNTIKKKKHELNGAKTHS